MLRARQSDAACVRMRADLERQAKDREAAVVAKAAAEEKLKEVAREKEDMGRQIQSMKKDLDLRAAKERASLGKISELKDEVRTLKAAVEQFPSTVKLERGNASDIAYIHSFVNGVRAVHQAGDLAGAQAAMKEGLVTYMRNHPVHEREDLPIKDLADLGVDFSFLPANARLYDPNELLEMMNAGSSGEEGGEAEENVVEEGGSGGVEIPGVGQTAPINPIEGTSDAPPS